MALKFCYSRGNTGGHVLLVQRQESWQRDQPAISQAHIQDFELVYPNIYPFHHLLECLKGTVLQIQSCRISMIQGQQHDILEKFL